MNNQFSLFDSTCADRHPKEQEILAAHDTPGSPTRVVGADEFALLSGDVYLFISRSLLLYYEYNWAVLLWARYGGTDAPSVIKPDHQKLLTFGAEAGQAHQIYI
jgi:hypothetical protein